MSHRHIMLNQCLVVLSASLIQQQMEGRVVRLNRHPKVEEWSPTASLVQKDGYSAPARLKGAAKDKRASKKAKNKKRGR